MLKATLFSAAAAALVGVGPVVADTIIVPEEEPTITAALAVAEDGDSIFVAAGTYYESNLTIVDANISIFGEIDAEGAPLVMIDGEGAEVIFVIGVVGSEGASIENFAFTDAGTCIWIYHVEPTIRNCTFNGLDAATQGAGIWMSDSSALIESCRFQSSTGTTPGSLFFCKSNTPEDAPTVRNCTFADNLQPGMVVTDCNPTIENCLFRDNIAETTAGITLANVDATIADCVFRGNISELDRAGAVSLLSGSLVVSGSNFCENVGTPRDIDGAWTDGGGNTFNETCASPCPGDVNEDGVVDGGDLSQVLGFWGNCQDASECSTDLNGDGRTDGADLSILLGAWGPCSM